MNDIEQLTKERDEARREAYRQWLLRQCDAEREYGNPNEHKRLCAIYREKFNNDPIDESNDPPPFQEAV